MVDCSKDLDPMTEGMLKMMGVFSELERNMISQRVKMGITIILIIPKVLNFGGEREIRTLGGG